MVVTVDSYSLVPASPSDFVLHVSTGGDSNDYLKAEVVSESTDAVTVTIARHEPGYLREAGQGIRLLEQFDDAVHRAVAFLLEVNLPGERSTRSCGSVPRPCMPRRSVAVRSSTLTANILSSGTCFWPTSPRARENRCRIGSSGRRLGNGWHCGCGREPKRNKGNKPGQPVHDDRVI